MKTAPPPALSSSRPVPRTQTRRERQEQTRARLIAVAREHFLRFGLGGAVVEKIAEEAGFTRGALYANFTGREELFLAVIQTSVDAELENFRSILESDGDPRERLQRMREAFATLVSRPEWVRLEAEFQANALRSSTVRCAFLEHLTQRMTEGAKLLQQLLEQTGLSLRASPEETALLLGTLAEGLALRQAVAGPETEGRLPALARLCFDQLIHR